MSMEDAFEYLRLVINDMYKDEPDIESRMAAPCCQGLGRHDITCGSYPALKVGAKLPDKKDAAENGAKD